MKIVEKIYLVLVSPKSKDTQLSQREYILNIILLGLILVFSIFSILSVIYRLIYLDQHTGESPVYVLLTLTFFVGLLVLSRIGKIALVRWLLILIFLVFANFIAIKSGTENPITLLLFAWTFSLTGVLIDRLPALILFFLSSGNILLLAYLQIFGLIEPDLHWKTIPLNFGLAVSYISVLLIIALISSLYNRQITNSLERALKSEKELQKERNLLEERVLQRTKELEKTQIEQINQLAKFAEFGKSVSGLLHDLINPITAISLNLGQLNDITNDSKIKGAKECSKRALSAVNKMESFVVSTKNKLRNKQDVRVFFLKKEINDIAKFFAFKAREKNINIAIETKNNIALVGDAVKFDQVVSNLLSNSIDAFNEKEMDNKEIKIKVLKFENKIQLIFSDNGKGIREDIVAEIFKPFFTTKKRREGIGIGLYITKTIIENDFGGSINVESSKNIGTTFYISIPNKTKSN